jgi:chromosome segregation protein
MQIRRLKLSGFKSFVEPAELEIAPGLTGLVGPNGCGKSNLLEAIRWAMGESSARSMRGGGMDDVIFAGTASRPQRDFAEVSLSLLHAPAIAGDDGEVEIVRRIERGAGSAYRANGRDVRARDVALLFADAATGAHSPALVSQGRIAAVIAARPAERRAMLEEAAGIAGLHVRRRDAEQKLRATEANLARLDDVLADMDARAQALRRQARAAERYVAFSERITRAEARTLFARWREAAAGAEAAQQDAQAAERHVAEAQTAHQAAQAQVESATALLASARAEAQAARETATAAAYRLDRLRADKAALDQRLADLAAQAGRIEADRAREDVLGADAAAAIERLEAEVDALAARIRAGESAQPDLFGRLAGAESAARDADVALADAMARQAAEQAERRVADAAVQAARGGLDRAEGDRRRLDDEVAGLADPAAFESRRAGAEASRDAAQTAREAAEAALTAAEAGRQAAVERRARQQSALSAAQARLAALDGEAAALRKALDSGSGGTARAIDAVRAAPGYEQALAAALGDDLDAALEAWTGADIREDDPPLPAGLTPLAAHVTAPPALARRLAQIGVVDGDAGQPLAVGQRIVTRAGRLRRWDGLLVAQGGAVAAERLVRRNRLDAIVAERGPIEAEVETARAAIAADALIVQRADEAIAAARGALARHEADLRQARRAIDEAEAALARLAARREDVERRRERIEADRAAAAGELARAETARAALPDGGAMTAEVARLGAASEAARQGVSLLRAEQALAERALAGDRDRLTAARTELRGWRTRAGDAARRVTEMAARARAIADEQATLAERPASIEAELAGLAERNEALAAVALASAQAERQVEAALRTAEQRASAAGEALASAREARAGAAARADHALTRRSEATRQAGERFGCPAPVLPERAGFDPAEVGAAAAEQAEQERLAVERERLGPVNLVAARELTELEEAQAKSRADSAELVQAVNQLRGSIGSLNREGRARLLVAFEAVNAHFHRLFAALFNGGQAHLALVDSDDPLEAGLEIMAQPPGKKLATLTLLSGGEQALTAVALIFGLFLTNPAPICVLDEVDAPLDDANVERFCDLLDRMVRDTDTRYLIVTHNAVTMSRMHRLFGVTMVEQGVSRLVSVDLGGAERLLAAE